MKNTPLKPGSRDIEDLVHDYRMADKTRFVDIANIQNLSAFASDTPAPFSKTELACVTEYQNTAIRQYVQRDGRYFQSQTFVVGDHPQIWIRIEGQVLEPGEEALDIAESEAQGQLARVTMLMHTQPL